MLATNESLDRAVGPDGGVISIRLVKKWNEEPGDWDDDDDPVDLVKNGDLVRLEHVPTGRNLHAHREPAPLTTRHFQVTGYGEVSGRTSRFGSGPQRSQCASDERVFITIENISSPCGGSEAACRKRRRGTHRRRWLAGWLAGCPFSPTPNRFPLEALPD